MHSRLPGWSGKGHTWMRSSRNLSTMPGDAPFTKRSTAGSSCLQELLSMRAARSLLRSMLYRLAGCCSMAAMRLSGMGAPMPSTTELSRPSRC